MNTTEPINPMETGKSADSNAFVRRCLYCKPRTGKASYFLAGAWGPVPCEHRYFGDDTKFTDGLCDECYAVHVTNRRRVA